MSFVKNRQVIVFEDILDDVCVDENGGEVFFVRAVHDIEKRRNGRTEDNCFTGILVQVHRVPVNIVIGDMLECSCFGSDAVEPSIVFDKELTVFVDRNFFMWTESQFFAGFQVRYFFVTNLGDILQDAVCKESDGG